MSWGERKVRLQNSCSLTVSLKRNRNLIKKKEIGEIYLTVEL